MVITQKEFAEFSAGKLENMARNIAKHITIRTYDDRGSCHDNTRETTTVEAEIIYKLAHGALLAYRYREEGNIDSILDTTEFTLRQFIPEANGCDTIYIPLRKAMGNW